MNEILERRVALLRERMEAEHGPTQLVYVELQCNCCGARQAARLDMGLSDDLIDRFFAGWHLTSDPQDADLCPACAS